MGGLKRDEGRGLLDQWSRDKIGIILIDHVT